MNVRVIRALVTRDLKNVLRNKGVVLPLIIVPFMFLVILPAVFALAAPAVAGAPGSSLAELREFIDKMPAGLRNELAGYNEMQTMVVLSLAYLLAPMFLIIPMMVSSVIAADSFAGEKERKTLEALLYTPTSDRELLFAKLLSAWIPSLAVAAIGFVLYSAVANLCAWPVMGRIFFPTTTWFVMVGWVAPAAAGVGLGSMVLVSSRVSTFQEAYQLGGIVVLPIVLMVLGQAMGVMYFSLALVVLLGALLWAVDAALLWFGVKHFNRGELIARL